MVTLEIIELIFFLTRYHEESVFWDSLPRGVSVLGLATTRSQTILVTRYYEESPENKYCNNVKERKLQDNHYAPNLNNNRNLQC